MAIKTFMPACRVTVQKAVTREQRAGQWATLGAIRGDTIDLTPYLGDRGSVTTHRSLNNPVGGFEITFPDQPAKSLDGQVSDSFYGFLEPMDRVEIRLARDGSVYPDGPPVVMRGFIRSVTRNESMDSGGHPQRVVTIHGDDYGCILELVKFSFWHGAALGTDSDVLQVLLPARYDLANGPEPVSDYVRKLTQRAANELLLAKFREYQGASAQEIFDITVDATVTQGFVEIWSAMAGDGTLLNKLRAVADSPWNELFLEDRWELENDADVGPRKVIDRGPHLVFRPTPFRSRDGAWLTQLGETLTADIYVDSFDKVLGAQYQRTDHDINNIYVVVLGGAALGGYYQQVADAYTRKTESVQTENPDTHYHLYGVRPLELTSSLVPENVATQGVQKAVYQSNLSPIQDWLQKHRDWAIAAYQDNAYFEHGSLTVQGNEQLKIGSYYELTRGQFTVSHYLTDVMHQFLPMQRFQTAVRFVRSDNYTKRLAATLPPVLLEGHKGVYAE